jgi:tetratricopeptide (TPR) repeat protein
MPSMSADEALRLRREALARKLTGGRRTAPTPVQRPITPPVRTPEMDAEIAARAAEALRQRHEAAIAEARRGQLRRYLETGKAALDKQDYAGAANAYRIAASLEPDDPAVQATCSEAMRLAAAALADGYWKQAVYEEGQERWAEAALSYSKVCAGRPDDAAAHERVAFATLKSSTNIRRAVEFARKAVELSPRAPEMRVTLARAYAAAGLEKSKQGELDRALELAGDNTRIQGLVAQVRTLAAKDGKATS